MRGRLDILKLVAGCLATAAASVALVAPAPGYDAWAWLLWGRELAGGGLSTTEGPAFKPLTVGLAVPLSALGGAAPWAFVLLQRAAAVLALVLAFRLTRRLAGGSVATGALGAAGIALCGGFAVHAAAGLSEGLLIALGLGAAEAWRAGRPRLALASAVGCALLRVETWPFLVAAGAVAWRRRPQDRRLLLAAAVLVPTAWLLPELVGSGDPLRSSARARVPNAGQPALAEVPTLASLRGAASVVPWPLWAGLGWLAWAGVRRRDRAARAALLPAAGGVAWIALVAVMSQAGFSGEPRYALPGAALLAIAGAAGVGLATRAMRRRAQRASGLALAVQRLPWRGVRGAALALALPGALRPVRRAASTAPAVRQLPRAATAAGAAALVVGLATVPALGEVRRLPRAQEHQWRLQADLAAAIRAAGGRDAVLRCGRPYVGRLRGPLLAYRLDVAKRRVEPDDPPRTAGVVFRSARRAGGPVSPEAPPPFRPVASVGAWEVLSTCVVRAA